MPAPPDPAPAFRSGYVALLGVPNAGKSTLVNRLLGLHLAAVAPRPQTTRHRILGILNGPGFQALLLDTPGLLEPKYALQRLMRREIDRALADADLLLLVVDATAGPGQLDPLLAVASGRRAVVALNKVDAIGDKTMLLPAAERLSSADLNDVLMVSALKGKGIDVLRSTIVQALPAGSPFYPQDQVTERNERFFVAEFIRESIFNLYGAEVPYATTVALEEFKERPGRKDYIKAVIHVERDSQKAILIGKDGAALKRVGASARRSIEQFLERPVYLELWVKVAADWRENEGFIRENVYGR
jgi:GTP-binding protein Era